MTARPIFRLSRTLAGLVLAVLLPLAVSRPATAEDEDRYVDPSLGFSFSKPRFAPSDVPNLTTVAVTLSGAPEHGFAPNVNVVVQNLQTSLDAYQQRQRQEMAAAGWKVMAQNRDEVGEASSLRTHARGSIQGIDVEFLSIAVMREAGKLFVLTCTSTTAQFPRHQAEFERVVASFSLQPRSAKNTFEEDPIR